MAENRKDSSHLEDFSTESIASMQTIIFEIFACRRRQNISKNYRTICETLTRLSVPGRQVFQRYVILKRPFVLLAA